MFIIHCFYLSLFLAFRMTKHSFLIDDIFAYDIHIYITKILTQNMEENIYQTCLSFNIHEIYEIYCIFSYIMEWAILCRNVYFMYFLFTKSNVLSFNGFSVLLIYGFILNQNLSELLIWCASFRYCFYLEILFLHHGKWLIICLTYFFSIYNLMLFGYLCKFFKWQFWKWTF